MILLKPLTIIKWSKSHSKELLKSKSKQAFFESATKKQKYTKKTSVQR